MRGRNKALFLMVSGEEMALVASLSKRDGISMREVVLRAVRQYGAATPPATLEQRLAAVEERLAQIEGVR